MQVVIPLQGSEDPEVKAKEIESLLADIQFKGVILIILGLYDCSVVQDPERCTVMAVIGSASEGDVVILHPSGTDDG